MLPGSGPPAGLGVERVDGGHLLAGKLEVEHVKVLGDPGRLHRLRDGGAARLQLPAQHHLRGRLAVPAADRRAARAKARGRIAGARSRRGSITRSVGALYRRCPAPSSRCPA
jgi:hypothetical protein